jgi:hypothetical protein
MIRRDQQPFQLSNFFGEEQPRGTRDPFCDPYYRRVGAMCSTESVVHIGISQGGELTGEARVVALFPGFESEVLQQHYGSTRRDRFAGGGAHDIVCLQDITAEHLTQTLRDRVEPQLVDDAAFRTSQMGARGDGGSRVQQPLKSRNGRADAEVIGDPSSIEGDVEVATGQDAPTPQFEVLDLKELGC